MENSADQPESPQSQPDLVCDACGRYGAYAFDGGNLCADCYAIQCSCCPEFGETALAPAARPRPPRDSGAMKD